MKDETIEGNMPTCSLTDELIVKLGELVRAGNFRGPSAKSLVISLHTFHTWCSTGRQHVAEIEASERMAETQQSKLVVALDKAEGRCFVADTANIRSTEGDVRDRDLVFKLHQKRFAKEYSPPVVSTDDETGAQTKIDVTNMLEQRLCQLLGITPPSHREDEGIE